MSNPVVVDALPSASEGAAPETLQETAATFLATQTPAHEAVTNALHPPALGVPEYPRLRRQYLVAKYGWLHAWKPMLMGEKPPELTVEESKVKWYIAVLIIMASFAAMFVFGSTELTLAFHYGVQWISLLLLIPLVVIGFLVYAMDRSMYRTIPRLGLLFQRREYGMAMEHLLYALCIGFTEGITFGVLIYTAEVNVNALVRGESLIPQDPKWIIGLTVWRVLLFVWTIFHAHWVNEPLPVEWGTVTGKFATRLGGDVFEAMLGVDFSHHPIGWKLRALRAVLAPRNVAPWSWNPTVRRQAQRILDEDAAKNFITKFLQMQGELPDEEEGNFVKREDMRAQLTAAVAAANENLTPQIAQHLSPLQTMMGEMHTLITTAQQHAAEAEQAAAARVVQVENRLVEFTDLLGRVLNGDSDVEGIARQFQRVAAGSRGDSVHVAPADEEAPLKLVKKPARPRKARETTPAETDVDADYVPGQAGRAANVRVGVPEDEYVPAQ